MDLLKSSFKSIFGNQGPDTSKMSFVEVADAMIDGIRSSERNRQFAALAPRSMTYSGTEFLERSLFGDPALQALKKALLQRLGPHDRPGGCSSRCSGGGGGASDPCLPGAAERRELASCMGSLVGLAVADALGSRYEFLPAVDETSAEHHIMGQGGVYDMPGGYDSWLKKSGAFNLKPGQWTDDTSMALCLADSLLFCEPESSGSQASGTMAPQSRVSLCPPDLRARFYKWWFGGYNNAFRLDRQRPARVSVGLGGNIAKSLLAIQNCDGRVADIPGFVVATEGACSGPLPAGVPNGDSGNGSLMRLAPAAIRHWKDPAACALACRAQSFTTHDGLLAAELCEFLSFILRRAIEQSSAPERTAMREFLDACADAFLASAGKTDAASAAGGCTYSPDLIKFVTSSPDQLLDTTEECWHWRHTNPGLPINKTLLKRHAAGDGRYNGREVNQPDGYFGAYAPDGLAVALHSCYSTGSFEEAILAAINHLGDADSVGAIAGQIAGAFYGLESIPGPLVDRLEEWDAGGEVRLRAALLHRLAVRSEESRGRAAFPG